MPNHHFKMSEGSCDTVKTRVMMLKIQLCLYDMADNSSLCKFHKFIVQKAQSEFLQVPNGTNPKK